MSAGDPPVWPPYPWQQPGQYYYGHGIPIAPPGCICPPTSEQTCQAPTCPRKARP
jgi:hypothetical protein